MAVIDCCQSVSIKLILIFKGFCISSFLLRIAHKTLKNGHYLDILSLANRLLFLRIFRTPKSGREYSRVPVVGDGRSVLWFYLEILAYEFELT